MEQLDHQRERIQEDLRGLVAGDVRCDEIFRQLYASDGSIYQIRPLGVVRPRTTADVVATVQYAADKGLPLHARGAGSGSAGESLGPGLVVDFSTYLHRVLAVTSETVCAQPGTAIERLNAQLRRTGRHFGPDPANAAVTTLGGMIAIDAAGSRWPKYGSAGQHVRRMHVVLADGRLIEAGREPLDQGASTDPDPAKRDLIDRLVAVARAHRKAIEAGRSQSPINRCGYHLDGILTDEHFHLARLLTGSEGTLGLFVEATVATQPLPAARGVTLLLFDTLERASRAVLDVLPHDPCACDLLDRRCLSLACEADPRFDELIPREAEAVLVVEHDGDRESDVRAKLQGLVDDVRHKRRLAFGARQAVEPGDAALFWQLASRIQPVVGRFEGGSRPVPVVEDVAVAPAILPEFIVEVQNIFKRHQITFSLSCHAIQGGLHLQPFLDPTDSGQVDVMRRLAEELYDEVLRRGGTVSGEHGCGLSRTPFVRKQYGPLADVFEEVKRIFDPRNILNPGKIVGGPPDQLVEDLRPALPRPEPVGPETAGVEVTEGEAVAPLRDLVELQLNWEPARVVDAAAACNGCGDCRTQSPAERMCPLFRILPAEESSPRAKANLIRAVLSGQMELARLTSDEFRRVADLCFHCHMCVEECPARVDVPRLMTESKGAFVAGKGLSLGDAVMVHLDVLSRVGSWSPGLANWALGNRQMRWLLEKTLGIAQGRKLPRVAACSFLRRAVKRRLTKPRRHRDEKIAYFVDTYANYHDPQLGEALLAVLKHNGVTVFVPADQKPAGTAAFATGALDVARRLARRNVALLAEAVRQGYHVVSTEPAAAHTLVREYGFVLDDDDARLVAQNTSEACGYLWAMHARGKLQLDLKPLHATVGYHLPCRLRALRRGSPGESLLRLIPGLSVRPIDAGCSGMAGTFGLKRQNYRTSLRVGWRMISALRDPGIQFGATECSACKLQMEQGTTKPTVHPIKLLALAYGLMPEIEALLTTPSHPRLAT
ncbi:MAG: anaerobic glycerol-3-phosphate dehydrogenase subunit C [Pirellulales bacterium]|nr:anaerobic glycerol-3-phosphate dehydrogenase subunit C [Pirellulales bacterium]